jgi:hypothetical protein
LGARSATTDGRDACVARVTMGETHRVERVARDGHPGLARSLG